MTTRLVYGDLCNEYEGFAPETLKGNYRPVASGPLSLLRH